MKYTKEYVNRNKVAIRCKDAEEKFEVLKLITLVKGVTFGGKSSKELKMRDVQFNAGAVVANYSPGESRCSICHTDGTYWRDEGYEEISGETFLEHNNILQNYEIY